MNKFGFSKLGNKKSRENRGLGYNKTIERSTGDSSVNTGSSYGSASSGRSDSSSLGMASTFASLERLMPTTAQPQIPMRGPTTLCPPCHLNCQCEACTKPNSDFLDGLLQLSPTSLATSGHIGDFSLDNWMTASISQIPCFLLLCHFTRCSLSELPFLCTLCMF